MANKTTITAMLKTRASFTHFTVDVWLYGAKFRFPDPGGILNGTECVL